MPASTPHLQAADEPDNDDTRADRTGGPTGQPKQAGRFLRGAVPDPCNGWGQMSPDAAPSYSPTAEPEGRSSGVLASEGSRAPAGSPTAEPEGRSSGVLASEASRAPAGSPTAEPEGRSSGVLASEASKAPAGSPEAASGGDLGPMDASEPLASPFGQVPWRDRVVERKLTAARERALARSAHILEAAKSLIAEEGRSDFTIQEVVARAQLSIHSFYRHFASKDDLLMALFEDSLSREMAGAHERIAGDGLDPVERLRRFVYSFLYEHQGDQEPGRSMLTYQLRLAASAPSALIESLHAQAGLLHDLLADGVEAGVIRSDVPIEQLTTILLQTLVGARFVNCFAVQPTPHTIGFDALWAVCLGALAKPAPAS